MRTIFKENLRSDKIAIESVQFSGENREGLRLKLHVIVQVEYKIAMICKRCAGPLIVSLRDT